MQVSLAMVGIGVEDIGLWLGGGGVIVIARQ